MRSDLKHQLPFQSKVDGLLKVESAYRNCGTLCLMADEWLLPLFALAGLCFSAIE
eukprot:Gb_31553 [translate_table: standard]